MRRLSNCLGFEARTADPVCLQGLSGCGVKFAKACDFNYKAFDFLFSPASVGDGLREN